MKKRITLWTIPICVSLGCLVNAQEQRPAPAVEKIKNIETGNVEGTKSGAQGVNKTDGINTINGVKADGRAAIPPANPVPPPVAGSAAKVETGSATGTTSNAKGVNKVDGIDTINGVKADGRTVVPPVNPVPPPPVAGTAVKVETGSATGTTSSAKGVNKVDGIDTINGVKADGRTTVPPPPAVPPPPVVPAGSAVTVGGGSVGTAASIQAVVGVTGINAAKLQNLEAALKLKHEGTPSGGGKAKAAAALLGGAGPGVKPGPKADGRDGFQEFEKLQTNGS